MHSNLFRVTRYSLAIILALSAVPSFAQKRLLTSAIRDDQRGRMTGHLHPLAKAADDEGPLDSSEALPAVTFNFRQTAEQQAALDKLLLDQRDPTSANYNHWLTPAEYADRFGASQEDIDQVTAWLATQNLQVTAVAQSRTWISFTGTAGALAKTFRTEFHRYNVNGVRHFANDTEPSLPSALAGAVRSIRGLNDFRMETRATRRPMYTSTSGGHQLSPDDYATIYNIKPLWSMGIRWHGPEDCDRRTDPRRCHRHPEVPHPVSAPRERSADAAGARHARPRLEFKRFGGRPISTWSGQAQRPRRPASSTCTPTT